MADDMTTIDDRIKRGPQSWVRETTYRWAGFKIRTHVERDAYDDQSRIYIEVFSADTLSWNRVQSLRGRDHADLVSAYEKDDSRIFEDTGRLVGQLVSYAQEVLS